MNSPISVAARQARNVILQAQQFHHGKNELTDLITHLGYIQIDTIAVIERAHHHTLWTRVPGYMPACLHDLQSNKRHVFEYWGHAMSYIPMADYRFSLRKMKHFENPKSAWSRMQYDKCKAIIHSVLERIREEGPLGSKDFERDKSQTGGTWWDWKPAKVALEYLFWRGDLMITKRHQFQKIYDLRERVLPGDIDTSMPTKEEIGRYLVLRGLQAMGIASETELSGFMQPGNTRDSDLLLVDKPVILNTLQNCLDSGEIIQIRVEGEPSPKNFALVSAFDEIKNPGKQIHILSPFDNLIIQRNRTKRFFNFDYTLECYVPEAKRRYGYFVLPILYGADFIGRIDCKADRGAHQLIVRKLIFEDTYQPDDKCLDLLSKKLKHFSEFNSCQSIRFEQILPEKLTPQLQNLTQTL